MAGREGDLINGRYRLAEPVGRGGMGTVWRGRDEMLHREVAVKLLEVPAGVDAETRGTLAARTVREARTAARLSHPGIITVFDVTEDAGSPVIVMELVRGRSLAETIAREGPLPPHRAARLGLDLVDALREAHAAGVVHRDLKPGNVLLTERRTVITDFGLSTLAGDVRLTQAGTMLGTPAYMAPEQADGRPTGPPTDLWGLGATLYAAVEGRPPYQGTEFVTIVSALLTRPPDPAPHAGALAPVLAALLQREPGARPSLDRAQELLEHALREPAPEPAVPASGPLAGHADAGHYPTATMTAAPPPTLPPSATPSPFPFQAGGPPPPPWGGGPPVQDRPSRARWPLAAAAAVVLLALVAGAVLLLVKRGGDGGRAAASASPAPSSTLPSPVLGPTGVPSGSPTVPAGYRTYQDATLHYSAAVPQDWQIAWDSQNSERKFTDNTGRSIYISASTREPVAASNAMESTFRGTPASWTGYQRLYLGRVAYGTSACDLEYTVTDKGAANSAFHQLNRTFTLPGGGYAVNMSTHPEDWAGSRTIFETFFATLRTT
ncbi:serine/threonine-protein kinase [Actinomadura parmotrematis]|uniref:non-specific serine/threonine protein kinase n=1 Tax=Actinomadura parmotrematis TaxID=2864039 RepID=A0ABS7G282_9ACTN|nr:serine/threonine-protein kinase [Actinomadura parmotrematis]MBW8486782.1 serine/threonine protein kinase [Actinomadura parmotrematis]